MSETTPGTLRLSAAYYRERDNIGDERTADEFDAAADAWEADRAHIEALEKYADHLLSCSTQFYYGDLSCDCGYATLVAERQGRVHDDWGQNVGDVAPEEKI